MGMDIEFCCANLYLKIRVGFARTFLWNYPKKCYYELINSIHMDEVDDWHEQHAHFFNKTEQDFTQG